MKADEALKQDVKQELRWDLALDASGIEVTVKDGIVTLSGRLPRNDEDIAKGIRPDRGTQPLDLN